MATQVWYCSECGDGPLVAAHNTGCPSCYHTKCGECAEDTIYTKHSTGNNHTGGVTNLAQAPATSSVITNPLTLPNAITYAEPSSMRQCARPSVVSVHDDSLLGVPTDGGDINYRWTCCRCYGDNSYEYDKGCSDCNNHWRCSGCSVYGIKG